MPFSVIADSGQGAQEDLFGFSATIAINASLSDVVDLAGLGLVGVLMPAAWTAAALTFQASVDGTTFVDLYDTGSEVNDSGAAASRFLVMSPSRFAGMRYLKVRSGTAGTPVNQAAGRVLTLVGRKL